MATFGYEIAGGNGDWIGYADPTRLGYVLRGTAFTAPASGIITAMHGYIRMPYGEDHDYDLELGIYEEDGWGANSHKFIDKEKERNLSTSGWKTVTNYTQSIIAGKNYILVAIAFPHFPVVETVQIDLGYDDIETNNYYDHPGLDWRWQDPWNKVPTGTGRNYSIYVTYTPAIAKGAMQTGKYWGEPI